ncbi:hypothetical protein NC99_06470 [Sunxiuqinia dokdonensis]|uniref:Uncharacterized protein n=1 Tax=Sunxiuqinia dokdonensis TaxID=1409788 RepID=A0A0L8VDS3_9BACT|nr:hypothetical protein NC99_06470 [Sunxiuqinia dokdonensis]
MFIFILIDSAHIGRQKKTILIVPCYFNHAFFSSLTDQNKMNFNS